MGNTESSLGTSLGLMLVAMVSAPFTGGASLALAGASMASGGVAIVQTVAGETANNQGKDSMKEYLGGVASGIASGTTKII